MLKQAILLQTVVSTVLLVFGKVSPAMRTLEKLAIRNYYILAIKTGPTIVLERLNHQQFGVRVEIVFKCSKYDSAGSLPGYSLLAPLYTLTVSY